MTREEFESILEEYFIEGYNSALEDIEEDILDEEAYDLERDYDYYTEAQDEKGKSVALDELAKHKNKNNPYRKTLARMAAYTNSFKKDKDNNITDERKEYPYATSLLKKKIDRDFHGNTPKNVHDSVSRLVEKMRKERNRGKIPNHSPHLKN